MRHKGIDKEKTRQKMIDAASQSFRQHGYAGIGVDGVARAAGVTSGAFYAHFGSKDAAFELALTAGLDEVIHTLPEFQLKYGNNWAGEFARYYLGKTHRDDLACGCAMATLTSDVVRSGSETHALYEKKMKQIVRLVQQGLAGGSEQDRRNRAWSFLGILIGGINIARAMKSTKGAEEIASAIREAAIQAAGKTRTPGG